MRSRLFVLLLSTLGLAVPSLAMADTQPIQSRDAFVSLINGKALTRLGITLNVAPNGKITGRAFGKPVTGDWNWQQTYFCRTLYFGGDNLGSTCTTVEKRGEVLRFTTEKGKGDYADLRLR
jgi:hypothetical protein